MDFITPQISVTADGSPTLIAPSGGYTYHSVNGAVTESRHVFIRNGLELCGGQNIAVLEAGLGSGINAWLTAVFAEDTGRKIDYRAVELHPVDPSVVDGSGFPDDPLFRAIHSARWDTGQKLSDNFTITKVYGDLAGMVFDVKFDLIYFDMFAPDTAPHLWSQEIFANIAGAANPGAALVTYSAKGDVKRALRAAGFEVERLPGAPGKRHMLRAVKI
ncbi:MAG: tRNA (5-methylaminomethyl-2-thiouridine)(34)-methyltransferase MnmD [Rikenellaceae bacterium]|nr:tRNA (5-methylaminomethyl-2-thiouridine)(34)-methyltransferase MnmD [Rikenellaceae bacterium]